MRGGDRPFQIPAIPGRRTRIDPDLPGRCQLLLNTLTTRAAPGASSLSVSIPTVVGRFWCVAVLVAAVLAVAWTLDLTGFPPRRAPDRAGRLAVWRGRRRRPCEPMALFMLKWAGIRGRPSPSTERLSLIHI